MRILRGLVITLAVWPLAGDARADNNPTPIAVPLLNANLSNQPGSPYPSTINIVAAGGPNQTFARAFITLHRVTHPCPEDLAILLVHNHTDKYLLMSNAGGCRPLQGTDLTFSPSGVPMPDEDASTPPYGLEISTGASN